MDEWGYDAVVTASQKAFAAPPGVAMVALSDRARTPRFDRASAAIISICARRWSSPAIGQTPWTPPISILFALDVALERYHAEGMTPRSRVTLATPATCGKRCKRLGFTLVFTARRALRRRSLRLVRRPALTPALLLQQLREKYGVVLSGGQGELAGKIVRFGTMGAVGEADVRRRLQRDRVYARAAYKWCRLKYGMTNGRANQGIVERIASSTVGS